MLKRFSIFTCAALTIACSDEPRISVHVPRSTFERVPIGGSSARFATVPFEVRNTGNGTVFLPACADRISATIQKRVHDHWETYAGGLCQANLSSVPIGLREGARELGDLGIGESGRYRVRVFFAPDASQQSSRSSASAAFDVH